MNKRTLCREIGYYFGIYFEEGGLYCIDNGEQVFRYDSTDKLLADWVDSLVENHHDTIDNNDGCNNSWEKEIIFIYSEVIGKYPVGVRPYFGKRKTTYSAYVDVPVEGNPHGKNIHLGTYDSIVDAIYARRKYIEDNKIERRKKA
jgi:hypothetical protein